MATTILPYSFFFFLFIIWLLVCASRSHSNAAKENRKKHTEDRINEGEQPQQMPYRFNPLVIITFPFIQWRLSVYFSWYKFRFIFSFCIHRSKKEEKKKQQKNKKKYMYACVFCLFFGAFFYFTSYFLLLFFSSKLIIG